MRYKVTNTTHELEDGGRNLHLANIGKRLLPGEFGFTNKVDEGMRFQEGEGLISIEEGHWPNENMYPTHPSSVAAIGKQPVVDPGEDDDDETEAGAGAPGRGNRTIKDGSRMAGAHGMVHPDRSLVRDNVTVASAGYEKSAPTAAAEQWSRSGLSDRTRGEVKFVDGEGQESDGEGDDGQGADQGISGGPRAKQTRNKMSSRKARQAARGEQLEGGSGYDNTFPNTEDPAHDPDRQGGDPTKSKFDPASGAPESNPDDPDHGKTDAEREKEERKEENQ